MENMDLDQTIKQLGDAIKDIVTASISVKDIRIERTSSLEFIGNPVNKVYGKGLSWQDEASGIKKSLTLKQNPDRLYSTEPMDLHRECYYAIDNVPVLELTKLGPTVSESNLTKVGTLRGLDVIGSVSIDDYIFWQTGQQRLGIGTESPKGTVAVAALNSEFIVNPIDGDVVQLGNYTSSTLEIITDNTTRIRVTDTGSITIGTEGYNNKITLQGTVGINVRNPDPDVNFSVAGSVRFEGKKFEVGEGIPTSGFYRKGDIVWNKEPQPTGWIGWVCLKDGTPGVWRPFGQIGSQ